MARRLLASETTGELPAHHREPFDRLLIAKALEEKLTLLTADRVSQK
jgi:PIN domain nuclease of toxin-antitoxin system